MVGDSEKVLVIASAARLNNSTNGNPRWRVVFTDGSTADTQSDASVGYEIKNLTHSRNAGKPLRVTFTAKGKIRYMDPEN